MDVAKVTAAIRKAKKKQVKDEIDRIKQAEKKKRRLEKALATSAAIRMELEKKKQKKIEEQERLDEEGAKIAEAAAMHVLLGEDSDDSSNHNFILIKDEETTSWDHGIIAGRGQSFVPFQDLSKYSLGNNYWENSNLLVSSEPFGGEDFLCPRYFGGPIGLSVGQLAAQAVSSLRIGEDGHVDAYMLNHMLRG